MMNRALGTTSMRQRKVRLTNERRKDFILLLIGWLSPDERNQKLIKERKWKEERHGLWGCLQEEEKEGGERRGGLWGGGAKGGWRKEKTKKFCDDPNSLQEDLTSHAPTRHIPSPRSPPAGLLHLNLVVASPLRT